MALLFLLAGVWILLIGYMGLLLGITSILVFEIVGVDVALSALSLTFVFWGLVLLFSSYRFMMHEMGLSKLVQLTDCAEILPVQGEDE